MNVSCNLKCVTPSGLRRSYFPVLGCAARPQALMLDAFGDIGQGSRGQSTFVVTRVDHRKRAMSPFRQESLNHFPAADHLVVEVDVVECSVGALADGDDHVGSRGERTDVNHVAGSVD